VFRLRHFYITRNASLRFRLYCDSESLLKRTAVSQALTRIIPRRFLSSEVDVEMKILAAVAEPDQTWLLSTSKGIKIQNTRAVPCHEQPS
jgi:hypothetical protein